MMSVLYDQRKFVQKKIMTYKDVKDPICIYCMVHKCDVNVQTQSQTWSDDNCICFATC